MQHLRLTHPQLDFWVDVRLREFDGRWLAVADLADEPDVGTGTDPKEATMAALNALGEPYASEMARSFDLVTHPRMGDHDDECHEEGPPQLTPFMGRLSDTADWFAAKL